MFFLRRDFVRVVLPAVALATGALALAIRHGQADSVAAVESAQNPSGPVTDTLGIVVAGATIRVGTNYQLVPKTTHASGGALVFSADNLPPWARIDPATGAIAGTPQRSDVGEYEAITITVADGAQRATSAPFAISVVGPPAAQLTWRKPDAHVDGSVLDDLAGYRIVYGRDPEKMDHSIFIGDPDQLSYEFNALDSGAWYFAVIAVTANGLEGPATPPAMKKI